VREDPIWYIGEEARHHLDLPMPLVFNSKKKSNYKPITPERGCLDDIAI
jgi:hypothetical protein